MSKLAPSLAIAAMASGLGADQPCEDEKNGLYTTFEGSRLAPDRYVIGGTLAGGSRFTLSAERVKDRWDFRYRTDRQDVSFQLSPTYKDVRVTRTSVIIPNADGRAIIIVIEYGDPMLGCFANGYDVYRTVSLTIEDQRITGGSERDFAECRSVYEEAHIQQARGIHMIGHQP
jgi:hypothetical protein